MMYVPMRLNDGSVTVQVFGSEVTSKDWLPKGCAGVLFAFDSLESAERFYGAGVPVTRIEPGVAHS